MSINIAIDGPAGAGKSTIAKKLAKKLQFIYVDTGAMYRAMALFFIQQHIDSENEEKINEACERASVTIEYVHEQQRVLLNQEDVTSLLRTEEVGNMASVTSAYAAVRQKLLELQQQLAKSQNVIMDGRDIGTCVLPNADIKIFLTARVSARAKRRFDELSAKGQICDLEKIQKDISERDDRDSNRVNSPLKQAKDAVLVDSSDMNIDEVVDTIYYIYQEKCEWK